MKIMKILKPGRVEQRKFVCSDCGSVLVIGRYVEPVCPVCREHLRWDNGEPYEEPTQDKTADNDEIIRLLCEHCGADYSEAADVAQILIANGVTFREEETL